MKLGIYRDLKGKDLGIFMGWIGGILLLGGGLWFFTQPIRTGILQERVNRVLLELGYSQSLEASIQGPGLSRRGIPLGTWYTLRDSENRALVFSMMADGIFFPCMAVVSSSGKVADLIPLTGYSAHILQRLPQGIIKIYIRRIEGDVLGISPEEDT